MRDGGCIQTVKNRLMFKVMAKHMTKGESARPPTCCAQASDPIAKDNFPGKWPLL